MRPRSVIVVEVGSEGSTKRVGGGMVLLPVLFVFLWGHRGRIVFYMGLVACSSPRVKKSETNVGAA